eukprot:TRINITY_DN44669_c0_g1_i1.p1 TRINITY_DN44669_c0_g1~~TRINITY_DN44669_c0_g1_i1.p1  ORF type:complete len:453 (+),score=106.37 TRINITY_DN44669_c0_g1_i1:164-1522(+)
MCIRDSLGRMGAVCDKDQDDDVLFLPKSSARSDTPPLVALEMGLMRPVSLQELVRIPSSGKSTFVLQCSQPSGGGGATGATLLQFQLDPPFAHGERRTLLIHPKGRGAGPVELCVEITQLPCTVHAPTAGPQATLVLLCTTAAGAFVHQVASSSSWVLLLPALVQLVCAAWLLHQSTVPPAGLGGASEHALRVLCANKGLALEEKVVAPTLSPTGLWEVPAGKAGRFRDVIASELSNAKRFLLDSDVDWKMHKKANGVEYYIRESTPDGIIEFKGVMTMSVDPTSLLFYITDGNQRKEYDPDFEMSHSGVVDSIDDLCTLCKLSFKMPGPFASNRAFVTVNYIVMDPHTKQIVYLMFSTDDPNDVALAAPHRKHVLAHIQGAYLISPTPQGCTVTHWSSVNVKMSGSSLFASLVSKVKPDELLAVSKKIQGGHPKSAGRISAAKRNFGEFFL